MKEYHEISVYFDLMLIQEGIFLAIPKKGTGAMGNAGFVNLGNNTIVFDSFLTPQAANDLRKCAKQYTNQEIKYVVNSHYHFDHVLGNQVFKDVPIISTKIIRESMVKEFDFSNINKIHQEMKQYLKDLQQEIDNQHDPLMIESLSNQMSEVQVLHRSISDIHLTLPTICFENKLVIHGSKRDVELYSFGRGHTNSDIFLYLPNEKIAFMGDLIFNQSHPWVGHGHIGDWKKVLNEVNNMDINIIVPGHGIPGDKSTVISMINYLTYLEETLESMIDININHNDIKQLQIPNMYKEWKGTYIYNNNISALFSMLKTNENTR